MPTRGEILQLIVKNGTERVGIGFKRYENITQQSVLLKLAIYNFFLFKVYSYTSDTNMYENESLKRSIDKKKDQLMYNLVYL